MKEKNKVVVIGDSLSLPRINENIYYEDTYLYKLSKELPSYNIICRSVRGNDSRKQSLDLSIDDDLRSFRPNIVIIHLGIVDCAPRLFSKKQQFILSLLPNSIKKTIVDFFSRNRYFFTKYNQKVYVPLCEFESNLKKILAASKELNSQVILISIASTNSSNKKKSHNFSENIKSYNNVILNESKKSNYDYIDFHSHSVNGDFLLEDGIHINKKAHSFLSKSILDIIDNKEALK